MFNQNKFSLKLLKLIEKILLTIRTTDIAYSPEIRKSEKLKILENNNNTTIK